MKYFPYLHLRPGYSDCSFSFNFPEGYVNDLKEKFPDWKLLHSFLDRNDEGAVGSLLEDYTNILESVSTKRIEMMSHGPDFAEFIGEIQQAVELAEWIKGLEPKHFPERVAAREEQRRLDRE